MTYAERQAPSVEGRGDQSIEMGVNLPTIDLRPGRAASARGSLALEQHLAGRLHEQAQRRGALGTTREVEEEARHRRRILAEHHAEPTRREVVRARVVEPTLARGPVMADQVVATVAIDVTDMGCPMVWPHHAAPRVQSVPPKR
jgi:hypothetical protein